MALNNAVLRGWAKGVKRTDRTDKQLEPRDDNLRESMEDGVEDEEMELEEGEPNALWSGDLPAEQVDEAAAEELSVWLQEHEPEIWDAVTELATALASGDDRMVDHARREFEMVEQYLVPEYPELTPEDREMLAAEIEEKSADAGMPEPESPEFNLMIAQAIATIRSAEEAEDEDFEDELGDDEGVEPGPASPMAEMEV